MHAHACYRNIPENSERAEAGGKRGARRKEVTARLAEANAECIT